MWAEATIVRNGGESGQDNGSLEGGGVGSMLRLIYPLFQKYLDTFGLEFPKS